MKPKPHVALCLFILLSFGIHKTWAQQSAIDSLYQKMGKETGEERSKTILALSQLISSANQSEAETLLLSLLAEGNHNDETLLSIYKNLSNIYLVGYFNPEKAFDVMKKYVEIAHRVNKPEYLLIAKIMEGNYAYYNNSPDSAHIIYESALEYYKANPSLAKKSITSVYLANIYNNLGNIEESKGNWLMALKYYHEAEKILTELKDFKRTATALNNIGLVEMGIGYYTTAFKYFQKAALINEKYGNELNLTFNYINMGISLLAQDSYDSALYYFGKSTEFSLKNNYRVQLGAAMLNMANVYLEQGNYEMVKFALDSAEPIIRQTKIPYGLSLLLTSQGEYYFKMGEYRKSLDVLNLAVKTLSGANLEKRSSNTYETMYKSFKGLNRNDSALYYLEKSMAAKDSLYTREIVHNFGKLKQDYEVELKLKEINHLQTQVLVEQNKVKIFVIISLLIVLLLGIITSIIQRKNRKLQYQALLTEKENDRLKLSLEVKTKDIATKLLYSQMLSNKNSEIKTVLTQFAYTLTAGKKEKLLELIKDIEIQNSESLWKEFEIRFNQVHVGFYEKLNQLGHNLTPNEIKLCSLLRLNLTSKEIAIITYRSISTVETNRSALRKKLNLASDENLISFLLNI